MSNFKLSPPQNCVNEKNTSVANSQEEEFVVKFWGVRGLTPTPGINCRYGGNTPCLEMILGGKHLIFDGGTGLRALGKYWQERQQSVEAHLFFTNSQSNRIQGFPFFAPAFVAQNCLHIYGSAASNGASIKQSLCDQMLQPHFPYPLQVMQSELRFHNLTPGKIVKLDNINITTALINRTQKSIGYRVTWQGYNVAYVTDLQNIADESERENIIQLINRVDLLITNAGYTTETALNYHDTNLYWETAVELAHATNVKQLVISLHHPDDDDDFLDSVQAEVKSVSPKTLLAHEGLTLPIPNHHSS
ncbi:MBL fold metallo-hydrolase [Iningainema tapete]|uniref:MBL fold metallo-hydrolase n=1 Tax=Iningainema tapete BLCC-T55 TaxID=2748662 RepID=A0A8J6XRC1_9CYAN|nr:MBL fold metallo-hydrolase [Iningainema tapete]MBD2776031.1 MBL fold metallo-hydrolase [Iningainema tapete BLCC-T55]